VRALFTALLACLFVALITADRFACPDGCTDEAQTQAPFQQAPSSCSICHGWSQASIVTTSRPIPRPAAKPLVLVASPTEPALPTVERPPKTA
jgi:hypothetical protein